MRSLISISFVLAGLAGQISASPQPIARSLSASSDATPVSNERIHHLHAGNGERRRKSLSFGPSHPHAVFRSVPETSAFASSSVSESDPFDVARAFVEGIIADEQSSSNEQMTGSFASSSSSSDPSRKSYYIRPDSYTDAATGVSHIYVRQIINGIEVVDGDMNLNIKDGRVLSFGSSFYPAPAPPTLSSSPSVVSVDPNAEYCASLEAHIESQQALLAEMRAQAGPDSEVVMSDGAFKHLPSPSSLDPSLFSNQHLLRFLQRSNCEHLMTPYAMAKSVYAAIDKDEFSSAGVLDPYRALLHFMIAATPSHALAQDIQADFEGFVGRMSGMMQENSLQGDWAFPTELISGVPDAISPVKAKLAYVQVPMTGSDEVALELVWHFEVEMANNWYEACVSADASGVEGQAPGRIIQVVDWASDGWVDAVMGNDDEANVDSLKPILPPITPSVLSDIPFPPEFMDLSSESSPAPEVHHHCGDSSDFAPIPPTFPRAPAQYLVFPWKTNDPIDAPDLAAKRLMVSEGADKVASPAGWHALPYSLDPANFAGIDDLPPPKKPGNSEFWRNTSTTWGNNVFAHENWEGLNSWIENYRPAGELVKDGVSEGLVFDYPYAPTPSEGGRKEESMEVAKSYINVTVTQLFFTSNMFHDLTYRYGFDEPSGNFQQYNFGRGGAQNDAVIANAQDGSGFNNANFMTPPDGQNGRCRMYLWNTANPYRDGDLEAGIVIHELSHGLGIRLTGGPANSGCLGWGEAGGMGEGWGDFLATTIRSNANYSDYPMGAWAMNKATGIRNYPYSLNTTVNPSTYKTLDKPGYWGVHAIGEVWAEMLWIVSQRLIAKHGYTESLFPPEVVEVDGALVEKDIGGDDVAVRRIDEGEGAFYRKRVVGKNGKMGPLVPIHGNSLMVQLVVNGMKLQKCRPDFTDARDAIIQADEILTGGENFCELWTGFATRGLGVDAKVEGKTPWGGGIRKDGHAVPLACASESPKPEPTEPEPHFPGDDDDDDDGDDDDWPWSWFVRK